MKRFRFTYVLLFVLLVACQGVPTQEATSLPGETLPAGQTPSYSQSLTEQAPLATPSALWQTPTVAPTPSGPLTLRIWLPPQFDPAADNEAARLLQERLDEFSRRRPDLRLEVRVKAIVGTGGLLDSLTSASAAAPSALPDLIALPRDLLEPAALKGLLHPYDNLTKAMEGNDWYGYAQELAYLQQSVYGLPFAGDALSLVHVPSALPEPPTSWPQVVDAGAPLIFPAGDPHAYFSVAMYQSAGGAVRDEQGRPFLDPIVLTEVLTFYAQAKNSGAMPEWITQFQNDEQAWQAFTDGLSTAAGTSTARPTSTNRADQVITWASRLLSSPAEELALAGLPTPREQPYTLATGWVWALAARDPTHQARAVELAEYLTESQFLAAWSLAAGVLPTRPSSLSGWPDSPTRVVVGRVAVSAHLFPSSDILISLGAPLQQAVVQVLKGQNDPVTAAQAAAASLVEP